MNLRRRAPEVDPDAHESFEQLKRAYPNYYADTYTFRHLLGEAMGHAKTARQESPESEWPPVGRNNRPPE